MVINIPSNLPETIAEAGEWLRNGLITSQTLTKLYLDRIKQLNPQLRAFITVTEEQALAGAYTLDAELQLGKDRGPLHGIPIVHKDIYSTAGIRTTVGSQLFQNSVPHLDATVVQHLQAAGAVCLGKTNMNEFAAGISGQNQFYGDAHNPWDWQRSPGGSSSGTAVATAARLCLGGTGTDTAGSIRVPASWCGLVGIRPTHGLVSLEGVFPRAPSLDVAGPIARCVSDVAALLDGMVGYKSGGPFSSLNSHRESYTESLCQGISGLRLGVIENYTFQDIEPEVSSAVHSALDIFARLGAEIVSVEIPLLQGVFEHTTLLDFLLYEFNQVLGNQYRASADQDLFGITVRQNLGRGAEISSETYEKLVKERPFQISQLKSVFERVDALITPTMPMVASPLASSSDIYDRGRQFTLPFSFAAMPSISIPCDFSCEVLPIGLQIVGNHFEESLVLRIAAALESVTGLHKRCP